MRSNRVIVALFIATASVGAQTTPALPSTGEQWRINTPPQSSLVFARDGSIIGEIGKQFRTSVSIASLPSYVPNAFVAIEDHRFYKHDGVDYVGIAAAVKDRVLGDAMRGASTITMQLAAMVHPDIIDRKDMSASRKLKEHSAARDMEKHYTKQVILEAYLNWVDLGRNWFGVEAAARHYFGKSASRLTVAEAASLAALPKTPTGYDPISHPKQHLARRNLVIEAMIDQGYIMRDVGERAKKDSVVLAKYAGMAAPSNYFVDEVRKAAEAQRLKVMDGGYRIYTTLDPLLQNAAVTQLVEGTLAVEKTAGYKHLTMALRGTRTDYLQGAVIAMDPYTGDVKALVGGRNYALAPFNRATTAYRQPGSSIKPLVYAKALESGIPINSVVPDTALEIQLVTGDVYKPGNADGKFMGAITMREALVRSRNPVAVQLGQMITMDSVAALAERMGFSRPMMPVPSSAIGASVVHPIEMVAAYTAFANNGQVVAPRMITRIDDLRGRTVYTTKPSVPEQVMDPRAAYIIRDVLADAAERGTGKAARAYVPRNIPVAGKTGTTNDNVDVWFMGMTPDLVAGVWLGFDRPKTILTKTSGGEAAAPIWGKMMANYYAARRVGDFPAAPDGLVFAELDRETGLLATLSTPVDRRAIEFFMPGTEPGNLRGNPWNVARWGPVIVDR